ncbi:MAG: hypothetical protein Tsb0034_12010 [Ekhidna sp.]
MKNQAILTLIIALISFSLSAQEFEAPKKGAKLYVKNALIEVNENDQTSFDVWLVKSRAAKKATFDAPSLVSPEGVDFTVVQDVQDPLHYTVTVKATEITPGDYSVTLTGKRSGIHSVTGAILSLKVQAANAVASKDGE